MLNVIQICEDLGVVKTLYFIKILVKIIMILIPVIIIVRLMYVLLKSLFKNDENQNKKLILESIIKIIIGASIFFIPTIVNIFVGFVATPNNYFSCIDNANQEYIKFLTEIENKKFAEKLADLRRRNNDINVVISNNSSYNDKFKNLKHIYIGDSKTRGMYSAVSGKSTGKSVSADYENHYWYAKGSQRLDWFKSSAYPVIEKKLKSDNYIVYHLMGTNDLKRPKNAPKYIELLETLAKEFPNSKIVVVSVTPVNDKNARRHQYSVRNKDVIEFNKLYISGVQEKSIPNLTYCDIYSSIIDEYEAPDGVHYSKTTYKRIYALLDNC